MDKQERLDYIRKKMQQADEVTDAVLPVTREDIKDEMSLLDGFREHQRDLHSDTEALNSDER